MTKAREIAELGQKLTVDASGNIDVAGTITADSATVEGGLNVEANNPRIRFDDSDTDNNGEITLDNSSLRIESDEDNLVANSKIAFRIDGDNKAILNDSGYLGVGHDNPNGFVHIVEGGTKAGGDVNTNADTLIVENNGNAGLTIKTPAANTGRIAFGDPNDNNVGQILYDHTDDEMHLSAGAQTVLTLINDEVFLRKPARILGTTTAGPTLRIESSGDNDSNVGPQIEIFSNTSSPATGDNMGQFDWRGTNSTGTEVSYARMFGEMGNVTAGAENGSIRTVVKNAGTDVSDMFATAGFTVFNYGQGDRNFAVRSSNDQNAFFVDGANGRIGLGTNDPQASLHITETTPTVILNDSNNGVGGSSYRPHIEFHAIDDEVGSIGFIDGKDLSIRTEDYNDANIQLLTQGLVDIRTGGGGDPTTNPVPTLRLSNTTGSSDWDEDDVNGAIEWYTTDTSGNAPHVNAFIKSVGGDNNGTLPSGELVFGTVAYNGLEAVERMRISKDGRIGIGTSAPQALFHAEGTNISAAKSTYSAFMFEDNDAHIDISSNEDGSWGSAILLKSHASNGDHNNTWAIARNTNAGGNHLNFNYGTNNDHNIGNIVARLNNSGDWLIDGGIYLGGNTAATNELDDYEKGTLTWRLYKTGHSGTGSNNSGTVIRYVKVGRLVTITGYLRTDGTNGSSGTIAMTGTLPFTPAHEVALPISHTRSVNDRDQALAITCAGGTTGPLYIYHNDTNNDYTPRENNVAVNSQTNLVITFQGSYYTSS
jgi:hypothetical protein